jgi:hypothetical protein
MTLLIRSEEQVAKNALSHVLFLTLLWVSRPSAGVSKQLSAATRTT